MLTSCPEPDAPEDPLPSRARLLSLPKNSLICVSGHGALGLLLWLCRHDFENAMVLAPGAISDSQAVDALVIGHTCTAGTLRQIVARAPSLGPTGVLVLH